VRSAPRNAASSASLLLTAEAFIANQESGDEAWRQGMTPDMSGMGGMGM